DETRALARRGFTIGAHSLRHTILPRETEVVALSDIERSIAEVSAELGTRCATFAFPNGNYTARLARHALACGARTALTTEPMWVNDRFPFGRFPRFKYLGG